MKHSYKFLCCFLSLFLSFSFFLTVPAVAQNQELDPAGLTLTDISSDDFLSRLVSQETFSLEGIVAMENLSMEVNDYYNFSTMSRFEIADWAYQNDLISEAQKIEGYCDLLENQIFENVVCLDPIYSEIENYANNNLMSVSLNEKISSVLEVSTLQHQNTRTEHFIDVDDIIIHDVENVLSDAVLNAIGEYVSSLKTTFESMGFNFPSVQGTDYIISLSTSTTGVSSRTQLFSALTSTTCLVSTHIYGVNNSTTLSNTLRQRIAHGMFHAIQNNYHCNHVHHNEVSNTYHAETIWFREACANWGAWATTRRIDGLNLNSFINAREGLGANVGGGSMFFPTTISKYYGGAATIVEIYEQLSTVTTSTYNFNTLRNKINAALTVRGYTNVTFADVYTEMRARLVAPALYYGDVSTSLFYRDNYVGLVTYTPAFDEDMLIETEHIYFRYAAADGVVDSMLEFDITVWDGEGSIVQYWYDEDDNL
ncbi:MAG: hypothetical protein IJX19_10825 [Clostridia bacterium]|nr:hypothetical protein [Clostridia bacterium]